MDELFAWSLEPGFIRALGYVVTERERFPEKIGRDCTMCARRLSCWEVCVRCSLQSARLEAVA